jgi:hypothetical protein
MAIVNQPESVPEIRRQLRVVANTTALVRAGRVVLAERVSRGETAVPPAVSIRATGVVPGAPGPPSTVRAPGPPSSFCA